MASRILLVRHGQALPAKTTDEARSLAAEGRDEARSLASALALRELRPDRVLVSPLVRAVQTAELLAAGVGYTGLVEVEPALEPEGDPWRAETALRDAKADLVLAVTHEPIVRVIAARLVQQASFPAFRTCGAVLIEDGRVTLRLEP